MAQHLIDTTGYLAPIIEPIIEDYGCKLVRVSIRSSSRTKSSIVEVLLAPDTRHVLTLDDCADISRDIAAAFDVEDPIKNTYRLEVSSAGIDRPLTRFEDFALFSLLLANLF